MNLYERLIRFLRPPDRQSQPWFEWDGIHPLTPASHHRITVDRYDPNRAANPQFALAALRFFFPDTPVSTWSNDRKIRVALWKRLLAPPFTHRACLECEVGQPRTTRVILQIDLNLSLSAIGAPTTAKRLGRFLRFQFDSVEDRWLLYRGQKAEFFWLLAIERKCLDLTRSSVDSPKAPAAAQKPNAVGEQSKKPRKINDVGDRIE